MYERDSAGFSGEPVEDVGDLRAVINLLGGDEVNEAPVKVSYTGQYYRIHSTVKSEGGPLTLFITKE